jgi:6-pyruvoyltetrahydropterin/6-carboxytetrahydropterin synthase
MNISTETYRVRIEKDYLVFSAAHFITFDGVCERLHGHNYRVMAEVSGELDENQYVINFILLRDVLQAIVARLDHHMLLPTQHPTIRVMQEGNEIVAAYQDRRWVFPKDDCVLLPVGNTTAELIARYLAQALIAELGQRGCPLPKKVRIGVDENSGQWAIYECHVE